MMPGDRIVEFSAGEGEPQPRFTFALPEIMAGPLRERGFDACPTCTDPAFARPFRAVSLEVGLHPPERPTDAPIRLAIVCFCAHCGTSSRATLRFDSPVGWSCVGQAIAFLELERQGGPAVPPERPAPVAPRTAASKRKGGRRGS